MTITVLRIGHRRGRDERTTTHVGLVARAFGADAVIVPDDNIAKSLASVARRFGGKFDVIFEKNWKRTVDAWNGMIVHLTMYGEELDSGISKIPAGADILIVVGGGKVPAEIYDIADFNISVGNQPHSEIAALAVFLDRYTRGNWLKRKFDGQLNILPNPRGKTVVQKNDTE